MSLWLFSDLKRECRCGPVQVQRYGSGSRGRYSIASICISKCRRWISRFASERAEDDSSAIRERIGRSRERQQARFKKDAKTNCNAAVGFGEWLVWVLLEKWCRFEVR